MGKRTEKTETERLQEMMELYKQLQNLGISRQWYEMERFYQDANAFVKDKIGFSGKISLPMIQRELLYELILFHPKPSNICLKYTG